MASVGSRSLCASMCWLPFSHSLTGPFIICISTFVKRYRQLMNKEQFQHHVSIQGTHSPHLPIYVLQRNYLAGFGQLHSAWFFLLFFFFFCFFSAFFGAPWVTQHARMDGQLMLQECKGMMRAQTYTAQSKQQQKKARPINMCD